MRECRTRVGRPHPLPGDNPERGTALAFSTKMRAMDLIELKRAYPYTWHSTFAGGWERILGSDLGLASTSALLDHFRVCGAARERLECKPRAASEWIERDGSPTVLIRDQRPLLPLHLLERVLEDGTSVSEW